VIIAANPRGAIYGTIVATAVIAASAHDQRPGLILAATVATLLVFWIAHVYSEVLAQGLRQARLDLSVAPAVMAGELSMLAAPALSVLFLLLGALGLFGEGLAVRLALWSGVAQLVGWGVDVGRRLGRSWLVAVLGGVVNGALGVVISCSRSCCTDRTVVPFLPFAGQQGRTGSRSSSMRATRAPVELPLPHAAVGIGSRRRDRVLGSAGPPRLAERCHRRRSARRGCAPARERITRIG